MTSKKSNQDPWAKDTLLRDWFKICFRVVGTFFLVILLLIILGRVHHKPYQSQKPLGWKNWDSSIDPTLIEDLNYNTGEVTYRKPGPGYKLPVERETFPDQMTEYVLENIDVEQLWDRISDEGYLVE